MKVHFYYFILCVGILSCNTVNEKKREIDGSYRGVLSLNNAELPFIFTLKTDEEGMISGELVNGEERIQLDDIIRSRDSLYIPMHIFDAGLEALITKKGLEGKFVRYFEEDYTIPFRAQKDISERFEPKKEKAKVDFSGKWEVTLKRPDKTRQLIGVFNQSGNAISGSFMSATGDFRFLDGQVFGNKMEMSAFDGDNIYLFTAEMDDSGRISGTHWSGKTVIAEWSGFRNENAKLADANSLTYLKEGYDRIDFRFPDLNGNMVSLSDEKYQGKVVLLQIFGTWCPNCMDETKFLVEWYDQNKARGVEIIGLSYELKDDFNYAKKRVQRMIDKYQVNYDFVIAGNTSAESKANSLPMLNHIMSFPTTIYINKKGEVVKIHTGFSGPGTGQAYQNFVKEFTQIMDELLAE